MVEETIDPARRAPRAIAWTLGITVVCCLSVAMIAVAAPNRVADRLVRRWRWLGLVGAGVCAALLITGWMN